MSHLLIDDQKKQQVKIAKQLLKIFPKYDEKKFANIVTGNESWVHYFEPVMKVSIKIWATKNSNRPVTAKQTLSAKKILYAIFLSSESVAIQVPGTEEIKKTFYQKLCPVTSFKHV